MELILYPRVLSVLILLLVVIILMVRRNMLYLKVRKRLVRLLRILLGLMSNKLWSYVE